MKYYDHWKKMFYWAWQVVIYVTFSLVLATLDVMMSIDSGFGDTGNIAVNVVRMMLGVVPLMIAVLLMFYIKMWLLKELCKQCEAWDPIEMFSVWAMPFIWPATTLKYLSRLDDWWWLRVVMRFSPLMVAVVTIGLWVVVKYEVVVKLDRMLDEKEAEK